MLVSCFCLSLSIPLRLSFLLIYFDFFVWFFVVWSLTRILCCRSDVTLHCGALSHCPCTVELSVVDLMAQGNNVTMLMVMLNRTADHLQQRGVKFMVENHISGGKMSDNAPPPTLVLIV